jgi:IclR family transcriptional regulator, pca regulon regulatory protein
VSPPRHPRPDPSENGSSQNGSLDFPRLHEPRYSQSLERGLAILGCFTAERSVLGLAEIADELRLSRSTTHRYVITLFALGYLEQEASRRYRLGLRVTDLGMSALNATGLREHTHRYLEELRRETSYTVNLAVLDGIEIVYVDRARSYRCGQSKIDLGLAPGSRMPAYCTAMGKVLLANLPEREQSELLASMKLTQIGPNTITSKNALRVELEPIREEGFAVNDQELAEGLHSIAAPVRNEAREVVAAVNLAAHTSMISLEELVDALGPHLISMADRISALLGYRSDHELARSR